MPALIPWIRPLLASLLSLSIWHGPAAMARADSLEEQPRLSILAKGKSEAMVKALSKKLVETRRVRLVERPQLAQTIAGKKFTLDGKLKPEDRLALAELAQTDLLLTMEAEGAEGGFQARCRLIDLRTGDISREISLLGEDATGEGLAVPLSAFVRHSVPIRARLKEITGDRMVLDLGQGDGVAVGTLFKVYRDPLGTFPQEIGTLRVVTVGPFVSVVEAEAGKGFQRGDMAIEQTIDFLFR